MKMVNATKIQILLSVRSRLIDDIKFHSTQLMLLNQSQAANARVRFHALERTYGEHLENFSELEHLQKNRPTELELTAMVRENRQADLIYLDAKVKALELCPDLDESGATNILNSTLNGSRQPGRTQEQSVPTMRPKLPPLVIPPFSGKYEDWPAFEDLFLSIMDRENFPMVQKFYYLRSVLSDEPANLIKHLSATGDNYETAWKILKQSYDNKRAIIESNLELLFKIRELNSNDFNGIKSMLITLNDSLSALQMQSIKIESWDPIVVFMMVQKFDIKTLQHWEDSVSQNTQMPSLDTLQEFLRARMNVERRINQNLTDDVMTGSSNTQNLVEGFQTLLNQDRMKCNYCDLEEHRAGQCPHLIQVSLTERRKLIAAKRLCENCLNKHDTADCKSKYTCRHCQKRHHTLLHENAVSTLNVKVQHDLPLAHSDDEDEPVDEPEAQETVRIFTASIPKSMRPAILATARVPIFRTDGERKYVRALIDQGSMASIASEDLIQWSQSECYSVKVPLSGLGDMPAGMVRYKSSIVMGSIHDSDFKTNVDVFVVPYITHLRPQHISLIKKWKHLEGLQLADPEHAHEGPVDLLLGAGTFAELILEGLIKGPRGSPIAQKTKIGWILSGMSGEDSEMKCCMIKTRDLKPVNSTKRPILNVHRSAESAFKTSVKISSNDGHFIVQLPFNMDPHKENFLGDSYAMARKRLLQQEKRLQNNVQLYEEYRKIIREYVALRHMRLATPEEALNIAHSYFVPHLPVIREDRSTTKVRIVFDASAKTTNGFSLNDRMIVGPKIQNDLATLLIQFRKHAIALVADVEKMYRMIWLTASDSLYQRILWRESPEFPIQQYIIQTVMFGNASAPFQAIRALQEVANRIEQYDKTSAKLIRQNFYVDDFIATFETGLNAQQTIKNLTGWLAMFGFKLHKWKSNMKELTTEKPSSHLLREKPDNENKTLGLIWISNDDMFKFKHTNSPQLQQITKRQLSSEVAKIFDPLGFLAPWTCKNKIFVQEIWKRKIDWDENVPEDILELVRKQQEDWKNCESIKIKRWIQFNSDDVEVTLHGFSDASKSAFAAVVYLKTIKLDGSTYINLVMAKSKVAPLTGMTIPRLELEAANLLARLMDTVQQALQVDSVQLRYWTDSEVVLAWIKNSSKRRDIFVSNRVAAIRKSTNPENWRYVPSRLNPADCASRGTSITELASNCL